MRDSFAPPLTEPAIIAIECNCVDLQSSPIVKSGIGMVVALLSLLSTALVVHTPAAGFVHAPRTVGLKLIATSDLGAEMLTLMDKWVLDDEISKPYKDDVTADACMVPIELECVHPSPRVRPRPC